jgi:hypothetical protein
MKRLTDTTNENVAKVTHRTSPNAAKVKRTIHYPPKPPTSAKK